GRLGLPMREGETRYLHRTGEQFPIVLFYRCPTLERRPAGRHLDCVGLVGCGQSRDISGKDSLAVSLGRLLNRPVRARVRVSRRPRQQPRRCEYRHGPSLCLHLDLSSIRVAWDVLALETQPTHMGKSCGRTVQITMTVRARALTKRAMVAVPGDARILDQPATTVRVFVDALERLGHSTESLLATVSLRKAELPDPDARFPCSVLSGIFAAAIRERFIPNLAARLAAEAPMGAFGVVDYLAITSETIGAALTQLARYLRLN